jgi:hypothetical protein
MKLPMFRTIISFIFIVINAKFLKTSTKWTFHPLFDEDSSQTLGFRKNGDSQDTNSWEIFYNQIEGINVQTNLNFIFSNVTTTKGDFIQIPTWSKDKSSECKKDCEDLYKNIRELNITNIVEWKCENASDDFIKLFKLPSNELLNCFVKRSEDTRGQWNGRYIEKEMVFTDMLTISHEFFVLNSSVDPSNIHLTTMDYIQPQVRSIFHSSEDCSLLCGVFKMKCLKLTKGELSDSKDLFVC